MNIIKAIVTAIIPLFILVIIILNNFDTNLIFSISPSYL